ncbi:YHYH protein [Opitutales bacterium]|nr:YHYH protein [Opitutales bacterium]
MDDCNGRYTVTKDFPDGTYPYFLTEDWPVIPRCFGSEPAKLKGNSVW